MSVNVRIPTPLRSFTHQESKVEAEGNTVSEILDFLENNYPGIKGRLFNDEGSLRHFVNIYVNGEDIRYIGGLDSPVREQDEVSIVPAVAGGEQRSVAMRLQNLLIPSRRH